MDIENLLTKWLEFRMRFVEPPVPRTVHMSAQINISLNKLGDSDKERDAQDMLYRLKGRFEHGESVTPWLSKNILSNTPDQMLIQYGLHHFHLSSDIRKDGFSGRSDYLLFAHISETDAYFVDIRSHKHHEGLRWVEQNLTRIICENWPLLLREISGVTQEPITDHQKKELWRKNINVPAECDGKSYIIGTCFGQFLDGTSIHLSIESKNLLRNLKDFQSRIMASEYNHLLARKFEGYGMDISQEIVLELVEVDKLDLSEDDMRKFNQADRFIRSLASLGLAIIEKSKGVILISN